MFCRQQASLSTAATHSDRLNALKGHERRVVIGRNPPREAESGAATSEMDDEDVVRSQAGLVDDDEADGTAFEVVAASLS